jgi:hypothetical protein
MNRIADTHSHLRKQHTGYATQHYLVKEFFGSAKSMSIELSWQECNMAHRSGWAMLLLF